MDARIVRSREALIQAMDDALRDGDSKLPSITELCAAAGMSRPTFYQHFRDVPALVATAGVDELQKHFGGVVDGLSIGDDWEQAAPSVIRDLISRLFGEGDYFRRVLEASDTHAFQGSVVDYLTERLLTFTPLGAAVRGGADPVHLARAATFIAAGVTWLVVEWIKQGAERPSVEAAADEVSQLLITSIAAQARVDLTELAEGVR